MARNEIKLLQPTLDVERPLGCLPEHQESIGKALSELFPYSQNACIIGIDRGLGLVGEPKVARSLLPLLPMLFVLLET